MDETLKQALAVAMDALGEIALAGMSGTGQESEEGMREWHARRAWEFIGIAAKARTAIAAIEQHKPVVRMPTNEEMGIVPSKFKNCPYLSCHEFAIRKAAEVCGLTIGEHG